MGEPIRPDAGQPQNANGAVAPRKIPELQQVMDDIPEGVAVLDAATGEVTQNAIADELSTKVAAPDAPSGPTAETGVKSAGAAMNTTGERVEASLRSAAEGNEVVGEQFTVVDPDTGREATILANSAPVRNGNGAVEGAVTLFQDITPLKEQERLRRERLAEAAHDLRNHLATVLSMSQILQSQLKQHATVDSALLARGLTIIASGVQRVDDQVDVILATAHDRDDEPDELQRTWVDLGQVVAQVVAESQVPNSQHTIQFDDPRDQVLGLFDAARLRTVLRNLLGNAIKFSSRGGTIQVRLGRDQTDAGTWVLLKVIDTGLGIPSGDLPHVFERFYRASNASGRIPGTGLGLSAVRRIVEEHGGTVQIDSIEGSGTTVTVRLPMVTAAGTLVTEPGQ